MCGVRLKELIRARQRHLVSSTQTVSEQNYNYIEHIDLNFTRLQTVVHALTRTLTKINIRMPVVFVLGYLQELPVVLCLRLQ